MGFPKIDGFAGIAAGNPRGVVGVVSVVGDRDLVVAGALSHEPALARGRVGEQDAGDDERGAEHQHSGEQLQGTRA